jgi:hypothetical protein
MNSSYKNNKFSFNVFKSHESLNMVTDEFIRKHGRIALQDPDTPSFMRKVCRVTLESPNKTENPQQVPEPISNLLVTLFGEDGQVLTLAG